MTRVLVAAGAFAAVLFAGAASARAENLTGKFGIGADATSSGAEGAQLRYGLMPKLNLQFVLHFDYTSGPEPGTPDSEDASDTELDFAVLAHYSVIEWPGLSFDVNGGLSLVLDSHDDGIDATDDNSETDIGLEFGFGPNWWVTDNLSLNLAMAVFILLDEEPGNDDDRTVFSVFAAPELVGSAGFTFWFR